MRKSTSHLQKYDVIIVGGGPAGLFAAYYLCENKEAAEKANKAAQKIKDINKQLTGSD